MLARCKSWLGNYLSLPFLIIIFIVATHYLYQAGFFYVHDYTIGIKIVEMAEGLKALNLPVRWSSHLGFGFGMPLFNFYAPLPYALGGLFYLAGLNLIATLKLLYLLATLITLLGSFRLGKKLSNYQGGLVLTALYTLAPYRAVNLFVRGALSEVFAMSFFPWVLLAIWQLVKRPHDNLVKNSLILFTSLLAIVLSHNLSALIFFPLTVVWAVLLVLTDQKLKHKLKKLLQLAGIFLSSVLVSAFYSLPSLLEKDATQVIYIFQDYFDYRNHFLYIRQFWQDRWAYGGSSWGPNDDMSFFLGMSMWLGLLLAAFFTIKHLIKVVKRRVKLNYLLLGSGLLAALCLFMSIQKSNFIWQILPVLGYLQFPWRFLGPASFFLAVFIVLAIFKKGRHIISTLTASLILIFLSYLNWRFFQGQNILSHPEQYYYSDPSFIQSQASSTLPDYIPMEADLKMLADFNTAHPQATAWLTDEEQISTHLDSQLLSYNNHQQHWQIDLDQAALVNFKIANFSGWQANLDQQAVPILTGPDLNNIQVAVPAGQHQVELVFRENQLRLISDLISLITLGGFTGFLICLNRKESKHLPAA